MFQTGGKLSQRRIQQDKKETGMAPVEEERSTIKGMTDEAMMNIICDDIATNTTSVTLRGRHHHHNQ